MTTEGSFQERYTQALANLTPTERKIGDYLLRHPDEVIDASALQIAAASETSDATVVRTVQKLGYGGLRDLKRELLEDVLRRRNMSAALDHNIDQMLATERPLMSMFADSVGVLEGFRQDLDDEQFDAAATLLTAARRVFTFGLGPGSFIAGFLALHLTRIGCDAVALSHTGYRIADDLLALSADDVIVLFAPYHQTPEVDAIIEHASATETDVILITEALGVSLRDRVRMIIKTPPTISNLASESLVPLTVGYALVLQVAARNQNTSANQGALFNQIASRFIGSNEMPSPPFPNSTI
ncbi:MAG: MurR/RpiR family transcriptional regulator [Gulosibacter sp.]|uniref:MurR/RpiR family transcriptional regulator n=1 Tax=Gulosibacter sp. TaxID=2817531 RepID=UPI003F8E3DCF